MREGKAGGSRPSAFDPGIGLSANSSAPCNTVDGSRPGKGERPVNSLTGDWCGDSERILRLRVADSVCDATGNQHCRQDSPESAVHLDGSFETAAGGLRDHHAGLVSPRYPGMLMTYTRQHVRAGREPLGGTSAPST
jgi:hypothetical protein